MRRLWPLLIVLAIAACGAQTRAQPLTVHRVDQHPGRFGTVASPVVGDVFNASGGQWSNSPTSFSYQWEDCDSSGANCSNITGATASSYTVAVGDEGFTIRVAVTAVGPSRTDTLTSAPTGVVAGAGGPAPVSQIPPYFADDTPAQQGDTLTVNTGSWTNSPTSYGYQWYRGTTTAGQPPTTSGLTAISGATSATYTIQAGDVGHALVPVVTAFNGSTASTPTTASGSCDTGAIPGNANTGGITSFTNTDPQLVPGCSPISAVVGATAGAEKFCTNSPATCGYADPLNQTAGVPAGTSTTTVANLTCNSGNPNPTALTVTSSVTIASGCVSISNSYITAGQIEGNGITMAFNHDDISEIAHTGSWWDYQPNYNPNAAGPSNPSAVHGGTGATVSFNFDYVHGAPEPLNGYWASADHDYIIADACWGPCGGGSTTHDEAFYSFGAQPNPSSNPESLTNSTLYNSYPQTAAFFGDGGNGGQKDVTISGNMFVYGGASNSALVMGSCTTGNTGDSTTNNRFSAAYGTTGDHGGQGPTGSTWTGNVKDETLATVNNDC